MMSDHNKKTAHANSEGGGVARAVDFIRKDQSRTFWMLQLFGWLGYVAMRMFHGAIIQEPDFVGYFRFVFAGAVTGFTISTGLRYFYRVVRSWLVAIGIPIAVVTCSLMGLLFSSVETFLAPYLWSNSGNFVGLDRFINAMFESTVLFAWTALYFGYHYYISFQEEKERALKATAMAHQAQLMMLRYQLNPHFLFNTLNAISTLVLEKATDDANEMLTKLSAFLRSSLVNQPTQKVSLNQELTTLKLYLDIEKVRFQERLQVHQHIDPEVTEALIPSLLLQPLIENAIKYAIAPALDGGSISVRAEKTEAARLRLILQDDGPGIPDIEHIKSQSGSGVGIANTKERLEQLYGIRHQIILENLKPSGLAVNIEIPLEFKANTSRKQEEDV